VLLALVRRSGGHLTLRAPQGGPTTLMCDWSV